MKTLGERNVRSASCSAPTPKSLGIMIQNSANKNPGESPEVICPSCSYTSRSDANYCGNCGRQLFSTQTCIRCGADNAGSHPYCNTCGAPLPVGPTQAEARPQDNRIPLFSSLAKGARRINPREWLRGVASKRIRTLILWSGSPIIFAAILIAAVAKDTLGIGKAGAFLFQRGDSANVASDDARRGDPAFAESASTFALSINTTTLPAGEEQTAAFESLNENLVRPRGVTGANGRLYVVDPSQGALIVLDADGGELAQIHSGGRRFVEPVDVAADAAGNIYVLDAGDGGHISIHDADGSFVEAVPIIGRAVDRSRGIDVDSQGRIWVALTPALAVAAFDVYGQELIRIATDLEGRDLQPVDVAFYSDDAVYVSTVGMTTVIRFSLSGEPLNLWPLVNANSVDGPHLSLDRNGVLFVTQPEQGGFVRISGDSEEALQAWVLPASDPIRKLVGIAAGEDGNLVVTDSENGSIYRIRLAK